MKHCLLGMLYCIGFALTQAQVKMPEYGKADRKDLELKSWPAEPTAGAMVLAESGNVEFQWDDGRSNFNMETKIRRRIKIFTDKGLDRATIRIPYYSDDKYEQVSDISGYVYNLNEKGEVTTTKLAKDQIFRQKDDDNYSSVRFSLPDVKPGSVFEYRYTELKRSYRNIDPWMFQDNIPTRLSIFEIEMPEYFRFVPRLNLYGESKLEKHQEDNVRTFAADRNVARMGTTRYQYAVRDVESLNFEPYMTGYKDYLQRIEFQLSQINYPNGRVENFNDSWENLAKGLDEDVYFGEQLRKRISIAELDAELEKITEKKKIIECIHRYVRTHFEWDGKEDFRSLNVKKINDSRKGSTGDINLLLANLLRHNGIEAFPVLVSTRDHGRVFTGYPFLQQFNSLNVAARDGDKWYILNGADKYNPTHMIPYDVMMTEGLMIDKNNSSWITLWENAQIEKTNVSYLATVLPDGQIQGDAFLVKGGYARNPIVSELERNGKEKYIDKYLKGEGLTIDEFSVKNTEVDTLDLEQKFKFGTKMNSAGDYLYFNTNLFTGLEKNPFVADKRVSDIDFGYNRRITLNCRIIVHDNFGIDELPKNVRMIMPDTSISFSRSFFKEDNTIILRQVLEFNRPVFSATEYPEFKEFYKKMYDMLNEQIVLKRKK